MDVSFNICLLREPFPAVRVCAGVRLFSSVHSQVDCQVIVQGKTLPTITAFKWLFTAVNQKVSPELGIVGVSPLALWTYINAVLVSHYMQPQLLAVLEGLQAVLYKTRIRHISTSRSF